jgi:transposase
MQAILTKVAGVDVHKRLLVISTVIGAAHEEPKIELLETNTYTEDLELCGQKLRQMGVTHIAMESTGCYWKGVYNVWHSQGFNITLGNASHMKNVPGRKTDSVDSEWIGILHRNGLIRPSYVPKDEFQQLRALNRHRTNLVGDIGRIKNRIQKVLEDGNCKLGSVVSDVFGVAGLAVLDGIAEGIKDPDALLGLIQTVIKKEREEIRKALTHCMNATHQFQIREYLIQYRHSQETLLQMETEINRRMKPYEAYIQRLLKIPGVDLTTAQGVIAEATIHMENFNDDRSFAAWAGVAPGNYRSAGRRRKVRTRHGNPALKKILIQIARGATKKKGSYFRAKYNRLIFQVGSKNKAIVAIANRIARVIYHLIKNPEMQYKDLGVLRVDNTEEQIKRKISQLKALGVEVQYQTLQKIVAQKTVVVET